MLTILAVILAAVLLGLWLVAWCGISVVDDVLTQIDQNDGD